MRSFLTSLTFVPLVTLVGCGVATTNGRSSSNRNNSSNSADGSPTVSEQVPADTTGRSGSLGVAFGSQSNSGFALAVVTGGTDTSSATSTTSTTSTGTDSTTTSSTGTGSTTTTSTTSTDTTTTSNPPTSTSTSTATATTPSTSTSTSVVTTNGVTLNEALFNIAKIKVKANRDPSPDEDRLCQHENDDDAKVADDMKTLGDDDHDGAGLVDHKSKGDHGSAQNQSVEPSKQLAREDDDSQHHQCLEQHKDDFCKRDSDDMDRDVDHDRNTRLRGPYIYDAISGKFDGKGPTINLADGSYRRIEFQLKRSWDERMLGDSFLIQGSVMINGKSVPFVVASHVAMNFRLIGDDPFSISPDKASQLDIVFDLNGWFEGVDFSKATVDEDGTIYVNRTMNHDLLMAIRKNINHKVTFAGDADGQPGKAVGHAVDVDDIEE